MTKDGKGKAKQPKSPKSPKKSSKIPKSPKSPKSLLSKLGVAEGEAQQVLVKVNAPGGENEEWKIPQQKKDAEAAEETKD